ncbi:MAG: glycogen synthase GlgA [Halioglobus sp.]
MARLLFAASEAFPLIKTGGLADVAGALPEVLGRKGMDVRLLLPGYRHILQRIEPPAAVAEVELAGTRVRILETLLPGTGVQTWLLEHPLFSERPGNPYYDDQLVSWADNAERFLLFSRLAAAISSGDTPLAWRPDVLHCNDWHTGPAIALLQPVQQRPRTVFTVHSLAHMGMFDRGTFERLHLPEQLWHPDAMEFYHNVCFIKGGLVYADWITTVSPTYAEEICHAPGGLGLEGLLQHRRDRLVGILNGIDHAVWDPATDQLLEYQYSEASLEGKHHNKAALQQVLGLHCRSDLPLLGFVGRLTEQKGLELLLPVLDEILDLPAQVVILGTGEPAYEGALQAIAARRPGSMAVLLAYDEALAHRIEAAADIFLMPSMFEPCGLNQLYSLRYGTLPVVRAVGGLADTVVDASPHNLEAGTATGFAFREASAGTLLETVRRATTLWYDRALWESLQRTAMQQDFSWEKSAERYMELYGA